MVENIANSPPKGPAFLTSAARVDAAASSSSKATLSPIFSSLWGDVSAGDGRVCFGERADRSALSTTAVMLSDGEAAQLLTVGSPDRRRVGRTRTHTRTHTKKRQSFTRHDYSKRNAATKTFYVVKRAKYLNVWNWFWPKKTQLTAEYICFLGKHDLVVCLVMVQSFFFSSFYLWWNQYWTTGRQWCCNLTIYSVWLYSLTLSTTYTFF